MSTRSTNKAPELAEKMGEENLLRLRRRVCVMIPGMPKAPSHREVVRHMARLREQNPSLIPVDNSVVYKLALQQLTIPSAKAKIKAEEMAAEAVNIIMSLEYYGLDFSKKTKKHRMASERYYLIEHIIITIAFPRLWDEILGLLRTVASFSAYISPEEMYNLKRCCERDCHYSPHWINANEGQREFVFARHLQIVQQRDNTRVPSMVSIECEYANMKYPPSQK
jgi:hypothetical protein